MPATPSPANLSRESAPVQEQLAKPATKARTLKYEDLTEILAALRHDHQSIEMYPVVLGVIHEQDELQEELDNLHITKRRVRQLIGDIIFAHKNNSGTGQ